MKGVAPFHYLLPTHLLVSFGTEALAIEGVDASLLPNIAYCFVTKGF
jgi:hypothetical protein